MHIVHPAGWKTHEIWSVDYQQNHKNCCHQMSDFKPKMHGAPNSISAGALLQTPLGELTALPQTS